MSTPTSGERDWWNSLPADVRREVRAFVNRPEVEIEPRSLAPHALPPEMQVNIENPRPFAVAVNEMVEQIEHAKEEVEGAIRAWHTLNHEILQQVQSGQHCFEEIAEDIWRNLAEPAERMAHLLRRSEVLSGLLDEMNLATGPDSLESLEKSLERVQSEGSESQVGILWESIGLRKSYSPPSRPPDSSL